MSFWIIRFAITWILWLILADKQRWREIFPVCFFAALLGTTADIISIYHPLWLYDNFEYLLPNLVNFWGQYIVATYLFIQWLPKEKTFLHMFGYWFFWTAIAIIIEFIHVFTGHITYENWNTGWSYLCYWILYTIFYQFHKIFRLERLSK